MFTDHSRLLRPNPPLLHYGVAVADVDGDGALEFFVCGYGGPNRVLKWVGDHFADVTPAELADEGRQAIGVAAGDLDRDGREEVYVLNTDTFLGAKRFADRLFDPTADGWVDLFDLPRNRGVLNLTAGRSVCAIDRAGGGAYGFYVANYGGPLRLYELGAGGGLEDVAPEAGLDLVTGGRAVLAVPLVGERPDLFAGNEGGPNFFFRNRGDGTFEEIAAELGLDDPDEHARGVAVGDFDGDGRLDLACGNWEGPHRLWLQSPQGDFRDVASPAFALPSRVRTVIAADFDNDGYEEVFFNNMGEPNRLFGRRDGRWAPVDAGDAAEPDGLGTGAAVADLDGDGRLELLVAHGEAAAQPLSLFRGPANDNAWLRVQPLTRHGAPARGAVVRLVAGGRSQVRVIDGGSGYLCQMEPVAHFGLGTTDRVQLVEVRWPDGAGSVLETPTARQTLRVEYPAE